MSDILIVDDEENVAYSLQLALKRAGHACRLAHSIEDALKAARSGPADLALLDVQLPDGSGLDLIQRFREAGLDFPVIVITAFGTVARAVEAMRNGAVDFLQKPLSMEEVSLTVERCLEHRRLRERLDAYRQAQHHETEGIRIVGQCPALRGAIETAERIARIPRDPDGGLVITLLSGETGTGKDLLARHMHRCGPRGDAPFVHVNCTAIPESLFESELFGHERGTFTDAREAKKGLLEIAHEGTLFLDEIGDLPQAVQAKLLVVIESGRFRRLGGTAERRVDTRVVAATNADLKSRVDAGQFRADLYYRLAQFSIVLPPLRDREGDVAQLADYFLDVSARKMRKARPKLDAVAREEIVRYRWPGNVRELAHVMQRAVLLTDGATLGAGGLALPSPGAPAATTGAERDGATAFDFASQDCRVETVERRLLRAALAHTQGNISEAARLLGLTRGALRHRLEKLGIATSEN
ncbi:MAG: sigma-54-dependent Fis family transcriptional regulator [Phycisphaerales bacterium]|nr:sigma-54-dependent Fis family transcriptional regulator [Phycisphaerales bacterium]